MEGFMEPENKETFTECDNIGFMSKVMYSWGHRYSEKTVRKAVPI